MCQTGQGGKAGLSGADELRDRARPKAMKRVMVAMLLMAVLCACPSGSAASDGRPDGFGFAVSPAVIEKTIQSIFGIYDREAGRIAVVNKGSGRITVTVTVHGLGQRPDGVFYADRAFDGEAAEHIGVEPQLFSLGPDESASVKVRILRKPEAAALALVRVQAFPEAEFAMACGETVQAALARLGERPNTSAGVNVPVFVTAPGRWTASGRIADVNHWIQEKPDGGKVLRLSVRCQNMGQIYGTVKCWAAVTDDEGNVCGGGESRDLVLLPGKVRDIGFELAVTQTLSGEYWVTVHAAFHSGGHEAHDARQFRVSLDRKPAQAKP